MASEDFIKRSIEYIERFSGFRDSCIGEAKNTGNPRFRKSSVDGKPSCSLFDYNHLTRLEEAVGCSEKICPYLHPNKIFIQEKNGWVTGNICTWPIDFSDDKSSSP